jgi:SAM-dependent methyltransferase
MEAQSFSVKRAQVEFHQFASLGEPERAMAAYLEENVRRGEILRNHLQFAGALSPFLEIGANAGHSSYMLANEFGAEGFALDISADALRYGRALMDEWKLDRAPVRVAGDAVNLPFADESLSFVCAFQMLSQFMDIEKVFLEVKRVLRPGGVFYFAEEPVRRTLSMRLYRAPYEREMKAWERRMLRWGLLGYFTKDVIGAHQEESFGIRQNHRMKLTDWHDLIAKHFASNEYELFVPQRGWGETAVYQAARRIDRLDSEWLPARLLGGTMAAFCRKAGPAIANVPMGAFEAYLRCPDCHASLQRDAAENVLCAACGYAAADESGVYNLLPSGDRKELYPGARPDVIEFGQAESAAHLIEGFYGLEGIYGNKYRWIGPKAVFRLERVAAGPQALRVRGHASETFLGQGQAARIEIDVNGQRTGQWTIDRPGLLVLEMPLPEAAEYRVELRATPSFQVPGDDRTLTVTLSLLRLIPQA